MFSEPIDMQRLSADIRTLVLQCIALKTVLHARWLRPMADEQQRLVRVRRSLTSLFVLRAAARGRLHIVRPPREIAGDGWDPAAHARTVAIRLLREYAIAPTIEVAP